MKKIGPFGLIGIISLIAIPVALAQTTSLDSALADLSQSTGIEISRPEQAAAICNQDEYLETCAEIGKKYDLYDADERKQVDTLLIELKGKTIEDLKNCTDEACVVRVAGELASSLNKKSPALARTLELTPQKVQEKKVIFDAAKEAGVTVESCLTMDPDTASIDLLRACARLAKDQRIQQYIPEATKRAAARADGSLALKDKLASGQYQCGDNTLEGCGNFCLNLSKENRSLGASAIPPVCRQIASEVFGPGGVAELEKAYGAVASATAVYTKQAENVLFTTQDGRTLTSPIEIGRYLEAEGERGNVEAITKGMDFLANRGFITSQDKEFAINMVQKARDQGGFDFNNCRTNPEQCQQFIPDEHRGEFDAMRQVEDIMRTELSSRGISDLNQCDTPGSGEACLAAAKAALPRLEAIAQQFPQAKSIVAEIQGHINDGDQGLEARRQVDEKLRSGNEFRFGDQSFTNVTQVEEFCRKDPQRCLAESARQGFIGRDYAQEKYQRAYETQAPQNFINTYSPVDETGYSLANNPTVNKEEVLKRFSEWLDNPQGPPPVTAPGYPQYPGQYQQQPYQPYYPPGAQEIYYRPCPEGQYRQESRDNFGNYRTGECIPVTTRTTSPTLPTDPRVAVCPALYSVESCPAGQERVPSYSSPECGTYYSCRDRSNPQPISVPPYPQANNCSSYGSGWHSMDSSGNCFNPSMTDYRGPAGILNSCSARPVYGCGSSGPSTDTFGPEYRDGLFFRSAYITCMERLGSGPDARRIQESLNTRQSPPWSSLTSKGQQDTATCEQEAGGQTVTPTPNPEPTPGQTSAWESHQFTFKDGRVERAYTKSESSLPSDVTPQQYRDYIAGIDANARNGYFAGWLPGAGDATSWRTFGIPNISAAAVPTSQLPTSSPCPASIATLLQGCHWMYTDASGGAVYCNGQMDRSARLGDTATTQGCTAPSMTPTTPPGTPPPSPTPTPGTSPPSPTPGTAPAGQTQQVWNNLGLQSSIRTDADPARIASLKTACANVPSASNVWNTSTAGDPASVDFGMPDSAKCQAAAACATGTYYNGSSCSTSASGGGGTNYSSCGTALINLLGTGCHQMSTDSSGNTIYCDGAMTKSAKYGDGATTPGCASGSSGSTTYAGDANSCPSFAYSTWTSSGTRICRLNSDLSCSTSYPAYLTQANYSQANCPSDLTSTSGSTSGGGTYSGSTTSGSCSSELTSLLGSGCHTMGNAWFNSGMTSYVYPNTSAVVSCSQTSISGCSGSTSSGSYSGSSNYGSCSSYATQSSCTSVSNCYWYSGSSPYCYYDSGSSGSSGGSYSGSSYPSCPSGQWWDTSTSACRDNSAACAQAGGSWNSASQYCQMPNTSSGGTTSGGSTYSSDPATGCAQAGGSWNGSTCVMPSSSPTSFFCPSGHTWDGATCALEPSSRTASAFQAIANFFSGLFD